LKASSTAQTSSDRLPLLLGWGALAAALTLSFAIVAIRGSGDMSIIGDEWHYAYWMSTDGALAKGLNPESGRYAIPVPFVLYQGLFETFGIDSHLPFRIAMCIFLALVTGIAYELMRRRLGYGLALPLAALIPLFGAAGEVVANSFRMPGVMALAAALGAFLALEHRTLARDVLGGILLVLAVASHPSGLAFVAAVGIWHLRSLVQGERRLATLTVVGLPAVIFFAFLRPSDRKVEPLGSRLAELPEFTFEGARGLLSALGGFVSSGVVPFEGLTGYDSPVGIIGLAALVVAVAWAIWRRRWDSLPALALLSAALIILAAPVFAPGDRPPNLGRYVFPAGVCVLIALAELGRGLPSILARRNSGTVLLGVALAVFAALALVGNAVQLDEKAKDFASDSRHIRAQAAALDAVRDQDPDPGLKIERGGLGEKYRFSIEVSEYYIVADDYGSPAWTPEELAQQSPAVQRTAKLSEKIALGKTP
jgi:hypothetical protein